jgi:hypothetical protein
MIILPDPGYIYKKDFLNKEEVEYYKRKFYSLPYYYQETVENKKDNISGIKSDKQQDMGVLSNGPSSEGFPIAHEICKRFCDENGIKMGEVLRTRINFTFRNEDPRTLPIHVDMEGKYLDSLSFLYYVNDSDGPTKMYNPRFDGSKHSYEDFSLIEDIHPIAGSALLMNADIFHSWSYPQKSNFRVSANVNFYGKPAKGSMV